MQPGADRTGFVDERFELRIELPFVRPEEVFQPAGALCLEGGNGAWSCAGGFNLLPASHQELEVPLAEPFGHEPALQPATLPGPEPHATGSDAGCEDAT